MASLLADLADHLFPLCIFLGLLTYAGRCALSLTRNRRF